MMKKTPTWKPLSKYVSAFRRSLRRPVVFLFCAFVALTFTAVIFSQNISKRSGAAPAKKPAAPATSKSSPKSPLAAARQLGPDGNPLAERFILDTGVQKTAVEIMSAQALQGPSQPRPLLAPEHEGPEREELPQSPGAKDLAQWPPSSKGAAPNVAQTSAPQTLGLQFDGATGPTETGAFPPDTMGAVGPTQFVVFLNGRMRSFDKTTGVADGVLNVDSDVFFAGISTPPGAGQVTFTSDPNVRFDRLSNRWFFTIIDVTLNATTGAIVRVNRVLIALSDAASNGSITPSTVFTFYQFQQDFAQTNADTNRFADYPSLGIDAEALYIGADMFSLAGAFQNTTAFVIPKAPLLTGATATVWAFRGLLVSSVGPFAPRGVDNYDANNTGPTAIGYIIGVDNATFSTLMMRRITNPGSTTVAPTISSNISIPTTISTQFPVKVPHLGNTGGNNGRLDALDDRLYAAHVRNGRLWTAHNIGVNNTGTTTGTRTRNAARWYEIQNINTTPTVLQAGTLFDNATPNDVTKRNYWIPSIIVSGQGHMALGCSIAGTNERINAFTTGRLAGDTLGTLRDGPGIPPGYTSSSTAYNPPSDPGGSAGRRWGDYSYTSLDPKDDMTIWTIQEYCNGTNTYGLRAIKLIAPPPATPATANPPSVQGGQASVNVVITGTAVSGSGFYDPGTDPPGGMPFTHISASVTGGVVVNSVTFTDPTHVTLNISTSGATPGMQDVTITNPDGQSLTGTGILMTTAAPCTLSCPSNIMTGSDMGQCGATVNYSSPITSGSCGSVTCTPPSGSFFPVGTTTVSCSETGGSSCGFTITVTDTGAPQITCPSPIVAGNSPGQCSAVVSFMATATDNCNGSIAPTCMPASGSTFAKGVTTVNCSAQDTAGNSNSCSFTVTVNDTQPPQINCPAPIVRNIVGGQCSTSVTYAVTASDNCTIGAPVCVPPSGSTFPVGTTTVSCSATDQGGNTSNCSFTVKVNDLQKPTITCPANVTAKTAGVGTLTVPVNYAAPTAADNCSIASIVCNPPSGSAFSVGTTTVTCTATDPSGNSAQCSFTVSVFDVCIEDDANSGNSILFISTGSLAGTYRICCGGQTFTGKGTVGIINGVVNLVHRPAGRIVQAYLYMNQQKGNASLQAPLTAFPCTITDSNVTNNSCICSAP